MPAQQTANVFHQVLNDRSTHTKRIYDELHGKGRTIVLEQLHGSSLPFVLSELLLTERRPMLVLTPGNEKAEDLVGDFEFFGVENAFHYPKWEVLPYDDEPLGIEVTAKTLDVFEAIGRHRHNPESEPFVICAPVDSMMLKVLPESRIDELTVHLKWGETINQSRLEDTLQKSGYMREPLVEARGEFSIRGGIIDIYPLNSEYPVRIDLFGDEIESIRTFDVSTQRSLEDLGTDAHLVIPPYSLKKQVESFLEEEGKLECLLTHLPDDTIVVLESPERYQEVCEFFDGSVRRQHEFALKRSEGRIAKPEELLVPNSDLPELFKRFSRIEHSQMPPEPDRKSIHVRFEQINYAGESRDLESWLNQISKLQKQDYLVAVVCDNDGQVQRFDELLKEKEISARAITNSNWNAKIELKDVLKGYQDVLVIVGGVQTGFALPDARLCIMTDREIFGRYKRRYVYKKIYKGKPIQSSSEIRRNDFVVHVDHGIGKFLGMRVQQIDGRMVDLIDIEYANSDKLLVPVDKIHKVQKYSGPESAHPALDRLGSNKWARRREKHSEEIDKLADELLGLYAQREMATRDPHDPDTHLQREFEAGFLYQETPDQLEAITLSKQDMEKEKPMDRLVCGDVGYGKTEVAIRAVFKCVQSGRQAALLCPTTILAQQHYNNFRERYADFPLKLEMISRFKSPKEIKETKKKLQEGELDVVIGTHALLSKTVAFKNLGLVVVDEEQRFGVRHKERLKEMRKEIDLLTLSATPIPRTLHMALSGLRDLSIITTPPPDRQPIKTKVIHFEEEQIAEAILRELNRGGQVYFVHNRVKTIEEVTKRLQEIVPHARITFAHGQMKEQDLEDTMIKFIDREFDILVATTIIESGVDIPNCNTIIINRADAFGLAQLYQLRGRVGRQKRKAYAYLIVPQGRAITETAVKRLQAIEDFSELGAGFSIAMRDLEIRGAGDILGKAQHGTITEIGFELYCELLAEKVAAKDGRRTKRFFEVEVRWDASCYLPPTYIPIEAQRVTFYKRFAEARTDQDLSDIESEMKDRFGALKTEVKNFIETYRIRIACQDLRIAAVKKSQNTLTLTMIEPKADDLVIICKKLVQQDPRWKLAKTTTFDTIVLHMDSEMTPDGALPLTVEFLTKCIEPWQEKLAKGQEDEQGID